MRTVLNSKLYLNPFSYPYPAISLTRTTDNIFLVYYTDFDKRGKRLEVNDPDKQIFFVFGSPTTS